MSFEHPILLWGALLGALPPLLHLLDRRRARPRPFAALDFLLRARRGGERSLRLKRLLLMLARMAVLTALPLAFARPHWRGHAAAAQVAEGPRATALVLDASGSMLYRRGGKNLFALAQREARERLGGFGVDEPATAVLCGARAPTPTAPTDDRAAVLAAIEKMAPTQEPVNLSTCIATAAQALGLSDTPGKRIVVFTDLQQNSWDFEQPLALVPTSAGPVRPELEVVDIVGGALPNLGLSDLLITPAPTVGPHGFQFTFTVHNYGAQPAPNVPVTLEAEGKVLARGYCDLAPFGLQRKTLAATFAPGGIVEGQVTLPPDALTEDDQLPFVLPVARQAKALLVDGAPSNLRYLDEAFFVQTALGTGDGVAVQTVDPESLTAARIDGGGFDVIALLNVHVLDKNVTGALKHFVEQGGGLLVALGDRVDPEILNESLAELLPAPLRLVKTAAQLPHPGQGEANTGTQLPAHFIHPDVGSPLFAGFGDSSEGLLETRIFRYILTEPPPKDVQVLLSYDDGAPAILLGRRRAGQVLLFTSSVAREWTDWPIRTSFVPVLQQAVRLLAHLVDQPATLPVVVGGRSAAHLQDLVPTVAKSPGGAEVAIAKGEGGQRSVGPLTEVGIWQVRFADLEGHASSTRAGDIPVVFDPRESDLRRIDARELSARYGGVVKAENSPSLASVGQFSLWTQLLALAAALFFAEALLAS